MSEKAIATVSQASQYDTGSLLLGTTLTVAALILVPAVASRLGLGTALTGAMRMALMRASSRAVNGGKTEECGDVGGGFSCH
ncbi:hypothetical protein MIT9_P0800 [Methylomarinovum caldicuralii]|uniref:Uncharacterized protein n=1 Tax=Methylomarinovum caldicuralii TaxID=438856 RepID=A0AAU9CNW1_9GAMM|nr:hypothetical protein [Methylomarinovum caldicuralii]BCX81222.1 hypothetical protein MIT9_P0800 [Methylomarinovum caldicuralii]